MLGNSYIQLMYYFIWVHHLAMRVIYVQMVQIRSFVSH